MRFVVFALFWVLALLADVEGSADVRLVDAAGGLSSVGLLQVRTDTQFGTVCGANAAAADVVCRSLGYTHGSYPQFLDSRPDEMHLIIPRFVTFARHSIGELAPSSHMTVLSKTCNDIIFGLGVKIATLSVQGPTKQCTPNGQMRRI